MPVIDDSVAAVALQMALIDLLFFIVWASYLLDFGNIFLFLQIFFWAIVLLDYEDISLFLQIFF